MQDDGDNRQLPAPRDEDGELDRQVVMLEVMRRGTGPAVLIAFLLSGIGEKLLDIVLKLLEAGIWHFWAAVIICALIVVWAGITRRQTAELDKKARQLTDALGQLGEARATNRELEDENQRLRSRVDQLESQQQRAPGAPAV